MTDNAYVTPMDLLNSGEDVQEIVAESKDYVPYELLEPTHGGMKYISNSRKITVSRKVSAKGVPFLSIELSVSELTAPDGSKIELSRPLRTWINTLQFAQRNRPGTTSSASDYLQEAGFNPKELNGEAILEALTESAQIPMECVARRTPTTPPCRCCCRASAGSAPGGTRTTPRRSTSRPRSRICSTYRPPSASEGRVLKAAVAPR